eukprot:1088871-Prymnesium_polylepis.1
MAVRSRRGPPPPTPPPPPAKAPPDDDPPEGATRNATPRVTPHANAARSDCVRCGGRRRAARARRSA